MEYLLLIVLFYFTAKFLFIASHTSFTQRVLFTNKRELILFVLNPILIGKYTKDKYFKIYYYLSLVLSFSWAIILASKLGQLTDLLNINFTIGLLYIASITIFICFLLYLSIFDIMSFSIPEIVSKRMLLFAAFVNIIFLVLKLLLSNTEYAYIFGLINLGSIFNLLGGLIGGGVIWIIVKVSKEKAMGSGDIDILAAVGLMVGLPGIFYSFFYTLMAASFISLVYVAIIRKYKGVLIPFVPFLATGFILCLVLSDSIIKIFSIY